MIAIYLISRAISARPKRPFLFELGERVGFNAPRSANHAISANATQLASRELNIDFVFVPFS